MRLSLSDARACLGQLCARAQDPREIIVLTRHGRDLAAIVSMEEVRRIWTLQDDAWMGPKNPLTGMRPGGAIQLRRDLTLGLNGKPVTHREAAEQVQQVQMTRAAERRVLAEGGLDPVEGGEVAATQQVPETRRWWWPWRRG